MIRRATFFLIVMLLSAVAAMAADSGKKYTLVIDAGHGGHDPGAIGSFSKEKDINLAVALAFGRYVEENCPDVKVIYTRNTDVFVTLQGRADIANKNKADLFISVHTNSAGTGKSAKGFSTYTLGMHRAADNLAVAKRENEVIEMESDYKTRYQGFDPNSSESYIMFEFLQDKNMEKSVKLAQYIQECVCKLPGRVNRQIHQAGFLVLRETSMPSCLIELGFITNDTEERELNDPYTQDQIARGIYQAFVEYKDKTSGLHSTGKINVTPHVQASASTLNTVETPVTQTTKPAEEVKQKETPKAAETAKPATSSKQTETSTKTAATAKSDKKSSETAKPADTKKSTDSKKQEETKKTGTTTKPAESKTSTKSQSTTTKPAETKTATTKSTDTKTSTKPSVTAKTETKTETKAQQKTQSKTQTAATIPQAKTVSGIVFKLQILSSSTLMKQNDPRLNDAQNVEYAVEDGVYKYTVGNSADYNEIYKLKVKLQGDFPQSFIVAYKDGKKMVLKDAIDEWKKKK